MAFQKFMALFVLSLITLSIQGDMQVDAHSSVDPEDYTKGLTDYLSLMAAGIHSSVMGTGQHGLKTIHLKSLQEPEVDPQFKKRPDVLTAEGESAMRTLDLQAKYMDNDLGEKNLMWSLRGSQSEKKLSNNLESADVTMFRRRLAEMGSSWLSQIFRNAYPVYSRSSTSNLESLDHVHTRGKTTKLHIV